MGEALKQHLIDPEICIRCYTCEASCPVEAITHDDENVVVDASKCDYCMECIAPCPTGAIDEWRVVATPYTLEEQFGWEELPEQGELAGADGEAGADASIEALDDAMAALFSEAHAGAGGRSVAPRSASKPTVSLHTISRPAEATVQGVYRLTPDSADSDVRHVILDLGDLTFPVLEGQSIGITPPGTDADGHPHLPRLYSISSPRDGERPNFNNLSLTVRREERGVCSNYLCDLAKGDTVKVTGPFGSTFLMPNDPAARVLMICTGTGSAPFRAFTMRRQRQHGDAGHPMLLVFGARTPEALPYFGPLAKVPATLLDKRFAFSRVDGEPKRHVQDALVDAADDVAALLGDPHGHVYVCGLKAMESGAEEALAAIADGAGLDWTAVRGEMREGGRYHVETY